MNNKHASIVNRARENIATYGWSVAGIGPGESTPEYAYTIGLTEDDQPELYLVGLPYDVSHGLLNNAAQLVKDGAHWTNGQEIDGIIIDFPMMVVDGPAALPDMRLGLANRIYGPDRVRVRQLVWPDNTGRYPWDEGCNLSPSTQPTIATPGDGGSR